MKVTTTYTKINDLTGFNADNLKAAIADTIVPVLDAYNYANLDDSDAELKTAIEEHEGITVFDDEDEMLAYLDANKYETHLQLDTIETNAEYMEVTCEYIAHLYLFDDSGEPNSGELVLFIRK